MFGYFSLQLAVIVFRIYYRVRDILNAGMGDRLHRDLIRKIQTEQMNVSCLVVPTTQYRYVMYIFVWVLNGPLLMAVKCMYLQCRRSKWNCLFYVLLLLLRMVSHFLFHFIAVRKATPRSVSLLLGSVAVLWVRLTHTTSPSRSHGKSGRKIPIWYWRRKVYNIEAITVVIFVCTELSLWVNIAPYFKKEWSLT